MWLRVICRTARARGKGRSAMPSFEDREKGFERKWERDQELAFKARARRNKRLGLWAAERLGLEGDAAEAYAKEVVMADLGRHGDDGIVEKVVADLAAKGVSLDAARVRVELDHCAAAARKELGIET
jgi:hypothetical protein